MLKLFGILSIVFAFCIVAFMTYLGIGARGFGDVVFDILYILSCVFAMFQIIYSLRVIPLLKLESFHSSETLDDLSVFSEVKYKHTLRIRIVAVLLIIGCVIVVGLSGLIIYAMSRQFGVWYAFDEAGNLAYNRFAIVMTSAVCLFILSIITLIFNVKLLNVKRYKKTSDLLS